MKTKKQHKHRIARRALAVMLAACLLAATTSCWTHRISISPHQLTYQPASVPNPMKGFASFYEKATPDSSLEYIGIKFSDICRWENGKCSIENDHLDPLLQSVADRSRHAILRIYLFNPDDNTDGSGGLFMPAGLYEAVKAEGGIYSNSYHDYRIEYPDFNNETLLNALTGFIKEFGKYYDGNPAIAVIQMGLYGSWGEWNMSGCAHHQCMMKDENIQRLIKAYTAAFHRTKLMARNPSLGNAHDYPIGYHDDNFLFNSSDFHTQSDEWKALLRQQHASYATLQQFYDFINGNGGQYNPIWDKWQTQMFGGELSGQIYLDPFGPVWKGTEREALEYCIRQFHVSWIMGIGREKMPETDTADYQDYLETAALFGYEIGITSVEGRDITGKITVTFTNYGVAPFYYDWPIEYWVLDEYGTVVSTWRDTEFKLSALLPDASAQSEFLLPENLDSGKYTVCLRFVNAAESMSKSIMPLTLANDHAYRKGVYEIASFTVS